MNSIIIAGIAEAVEVKSLKSGHQLVELGVKTVEEYVTNEGEKKTTETWFKVVAWGKLAKRIESLATGAYVIVQGAMRARSYDGYQGKVVDWELSAAKIVQIGHVGMAADKVDEEPMPGKFQEAPSGEES